MNARDFLSGFDGARESRRRVEPAPPVRRRSALRPSSAGAGPGAALPTDSLDSRAPDFIGSTVRMMDRLTDRSRVGVTPVHVSSILAADWCPRRHVLAARHGDTSSRYVAGQDRIVWAMGRAAENHARTQFIAGHGAHRVLGEWHCGCKATSYVGRGCTEVEEPEHCPQCGGPVNIYDEYPLEGSGAQAHVDLVFLDPYGANVTEFKSMNREDWTALTEPVASHMIQAGGYRDLIHLTTEYTVASVRIVYVCKDYLRPGVSPYKEFVITDASGNMPPAIAASVTNLLETAERVTTTVRGGGPLPARYPVCVSPTVPKARNCSQCTLCFSLDP